MSNQSTNSQKSNFNLSKSIKKRSLNSNIQSKFVNKMIKQQFNDKSRPKFFCFDDEYYEIKYQRKFYDLTIDGECFHEYESIFERLKEIEGCTGVKDLQMTSTRTLAG
ncbi:unnamed protein product [Brachionus calyciflorus]|uniref:Uncharacterized protein n=1 Tax=Brachionus calyciflorus TaxID=104777 RepID=A0A814SMW5_9BILA|nr:unnamed protein product [Brachionus calyciflorus]